MFADEQLRGPYALWHHTHVFEDAQGGTRMTDRVRYRLPFGPLGEVVPVPQERADLVLGLGPRVGLSEPDFDCGRCLVDARVADVLLTLGTRGHLIAESARKSGMNRSNIHEFTELDPIVDWLTKNLTSNDAVLIKGSHGLRMDRISAALEVRS